MMNHNFGRAATALVFFGVLAAGCSNGSRGGSEQASAAPSISQTAATASDAPTGDATAEPTIAEPTTASANAQSASSGTCPLVASDRVEAAMHLSVASIDVTSNSNGCTFHFKGGDHGDLVVTYAAQGGRDELDSVKKASAGAKAIFGGIVKGASAPPAVMGVISATPPPDVAKVGDDQVFLTEGPVTQFYASKGDAYVEVNGGFLPEGVSRWVLLPAIAGSVLATR